MGQITRSKIPARDGGVVCVEGAVGETIFPAVRIKYDKQSKISSTHLGEGLSTSMETRVALLALLHQFMK